MPGPPIPLDPLGVEVREMHWRLNEVNGYENWMRTWIADLKKRVGGLELEGRNPRPERDYEALRHEMQSWANLSAQRLKAVENKLRQLEAQI